MSGLWSGYWKPPLPSEKEEMTETERLNLECDGLKLRLFRVETERDELLMALQQIARGPVMPLPDPIAHSWQAFGERAHQAMRDLIQIARAAITKAEGGK